MTEVTPAQLEPMPEDWQRALVAVLHPDVTLGADAGTLVRGAAAPKAFQGVRAVAEPALMFARYTAAAQQVMVNDSMGLTAWSTAASARSWPSPSPTAASPACTSSPTPSGPTVRRCPA